MPITQDVSFNADVPIRGEEPSIFATKANAAWVELKRVFDEDLHNFSVQANALETNVNTKEASATSAANSAATSAAAATAAANRAEAVVIPTEATYSLAGINTLIDKMYAGVGFLNNFTFDNAFTIGTTPNSFTVKSDTYWFKNTLLSVSNTVITRTSAPNYESQLSVHDVVMLSEGGTFVISRQNNAITHGATFDSFVWDSAQNCYTKSGVRWFYVIQVHCRNQGMYHPVYNPNGTKLASDSLPWYSTTVAFSSVADCFNASKLLSASGYIGTISGRADGLFYDQVHEGDLVGFESRYSAIKTEDYNRLIDREFNKLVAGTYRGTEGEVVTRYKQFILFGATFTGGVTYVSSSGAGTDNISIIDALYTDVLIKGNSGTWYKGFISSIYNVALKGEHGNVSTDFTDNNGTVYDIIYLTKTTRTKSNTLTHTDIIGSPANYPTAWKTSGVSGTPLIVAEDGTSLLPTGALATFKLSRKANATPLQVLKSTNSGVTWTALTVTTHYTFNIITNTITFTAGNIPLTTDLIRVTYQTHTNMAVATANSEVVASGRAMAMNGYAMAHLGYSLIGKVMTASTSPYSQDGYGAWGYRIDPTTLKFSTTSTEAPIHSSFALGGTALGVPAVKIGMYITRSNGKAYLQLVFKEMKHNGTSVGDDAKFNIVDNVSTTIDNNAQTVLIGQKRVELPYFISAAE